MRQLLPRPAFMLVGLALVCVVAGTLFWKNSRSASPVPPGSAALRASIDPETGELVQGHQPAGDGLELERALSRSTEGLVEVVHEDGSVSVNLQGRFQSASVARINPDGEVETTCVEDAGQAEAFMNDERAEVTK